MKRIGTLFMLLIVLCASLCPAAAEEEGSPYSVQNKSVYDTASSDTVIDVPGTYSVGETLNAGIYTIFSDEACNGRVQVACAEDEALREYDLVGETSYTLYLAEGNTITLPDHCRMQRVSYQPEFQTPFEKVSISQRRFITLFELPMFVYAVTNIPGKNGYVAVSSIASAQGETEPSYTFLSDGEVIHLDLQNHFDTLVEFVNCVVWWDENSEG